MPEFDLKLSDGSVKAGLVTIKDLDGTVRSFKITAQEALDVIEGRVRVPPGVTVEEWDSGRATLGGITVDVGEAEKFSGGTLVMLSEDVVDGRIIRKSARLPDGVSSVSITDGKVVWTEDTK